MTAQNKKMVEFKTNYILTGLRKEEKEALRTSSMIVNLYDLVYNWVINEWFYSPLSSETVQALKEDYEVNHILGINLNSI